LETEKKILEDLFSLVLSKFKIDHPPGNLKFNYLGISQKLKIAHFNGKVLSISLKLNFTPNTLGCYGLIFQVVLAVGSGVELYYTTTEIPSPPLPYSFAYAAGRAPGHIDRTHSESSDGSGVVRGKLFHSCVPRIHRAIEQLRATPPLRFSVVAAANIPPKEIRRKSRTSVVTFSFNFLLIKCFYLQRYHVFCLGKIDH